MNPYREPAEVKPREDLHDCRRWKDGWLCAMCKYKHGAKGD